MQVFCNTSTNLNLGFFCAHTSAPRESMKTMSAAGVISAGSVCSLSTVKFTDTWFKSVDFDNCSMVSSGSAVAKTAGLGLDGS